VGEAMSALQKEIVCALNNKMYVAGIPCNLAKAFHCVSKRLCSWDLCFYGIQGTAGQWFKSYIHERKKKVEKIHHIQTIQNAHNGGHKISIPLGFNTWFSMFFHICVYIYIYDVFLSIETYISDTNDTNIILVLLFHIHRSIKNCIHGVFSYSKDGLKSVHAH